MQNQFRIGGYSMHKMYDIFKSVWFKMTVAVCVKVLRTGEIHLKQPSSFEDF